MSNIDEDKPLLRNPMVAGVSYFSRSSIATAVTGDTMPPQSLKQVQIRLFGVCIIAVYVLVYLTLSSEPKVHHIDLVQNQTSVMEMRLFHAQKVAYELSRAFPKVPASVWCIDGRLRHEQSQRRPMGLCYLKVPRAASSTLAGVNKRIARNFARRQGLQTSSCIRHDGHVPGMYYSKRDKLSFLWTAVRDPTSRALSRVATELATKPSKLVDETMIRTVLKNTDVHRGSVSSGRGGFQLQYSMLTIIDEWSAWDPSDPTHIINPSIVRAQVARVINGYDFIAVTERLDESLVALQLLLGLDVHDILHFSSKVRNSYSLRRFRNGRQKFQCVQQTQLDLSNLDNLREYLESTEWYAQNYGDFILHTAANYSLDRTIHQLGQETFDRALARYRSLLLRAREMCSARVVFPCSTNGTLQMEESKDNCYDGDEGCGYACLDEFKSLNQTRR